MHRPLHGTSSIALFAALALAACSDSAAPQPEAGSLRVTVLAEDEPVAGATVRVTGPETRTSDTGPDGSVRFGSLATGSYAVALAEVPAAVRCPSTTATATVSADATVETEFDCDFVRTATISGKVTVDDEGLHLATVEAEGPDGVATRVTNQGAYRFIAMRSGRYTVRLTPVSPVGSCDFLATEVELAPGATEVVDFTCSRYPIFHDFEDDMVGSEPRTGPTPLPGRAAALGRGYMVIRDATGQMESRHLYAVAENALADLSWLFPDGISGRTVRLETTVAIDGLGDGHFLQSKGRYDVHVGALFAKLTHLADGTLHAEVQDGRRAIGTYTAGEPFRVRMDIDLISETWAVTLDHELDGFENDERIAGLIPPAGGADELHTLSLLTQAFATDDRAAGVAYDDVLIDILGGG